MDNKPVNQLLLLVEYRSGLNRSKIAQELGWSRQMYYKYLNCIFRIKQEDIIKIWKQFNLPAEEVLTALQLSIN